MSGQTTVAVAGRRQLLGRRVLGAGICVVIQQVVGSAIRLGGNLLLTRLLPPEAFGVIAIVYAVSTGLALLSDLGINQNVLVSRRGDDPVFLQTAWTMQVVRSLCIGLACATCGAAVYASTWLGLFEPGTVYSDARLPFILCAFALTTFAAGFESIKIRQAQRQLHLVRLTLLELGSQAVGLIGTIVLAYSFRSVWALVAGAAISGLVKIVGSHVLLPGVKARFRWDRECVRNLIQFGRWIMASSALWFFIQSGDKLLLGGIVDARTVGYYAIATILLGVVQTLFLALVSSVMLPSLSQVSREDQQRLRRAFLRFQLQSDLFLFSTAGFLFVAGPSIAGLLYNQHYASVGSILSALSFGLIGLRYMVVEQYCIMQSQARVLAGWNALRAATMVLALPTGYALFGFNGALGAVILTQFITWPLAIRFKIRHGLQDYRSELVGIPMLVLGCALGQAYNWFFGLIFGIPH
ncbi:Oligosaccharide flippase family protein [Rhodovastum atsumiense]|uniref:oligosaccharide flippase family protein n=1 Tax=Rhodovastum atsumiense TaxID=504468 RepID=UPI00139F2BE6|nr:oligosaccharide flippase family protein [Rhodovastum atsumiense]CAH2598847.1 Oligosaccharide flippase family protein [Rhodovastum atsumiense]